MHDPSVFAVDDSPSGRIALALELSALDPDAVHEPWIADSLRRVVVDRLWAHRPDLVAPVKTGHGVSFAGFDESDDEPASAVVESGPLGGVAQLLVDGTAELVRIVRARRRKGAAPVLRRGPAPIEGQIAMVEAYPDVSDVERNELLATIVGARVANGGEWPSFQDCLRRYDELGLLPPADYAPLGGFVAAVEWAQRTEVGA